AWERTGAEAPTGSVASGPAPDQGQDLASRMAGHADLPVVGGLAFSVVDATTGTVIAERDSDAALVPASTLKLLTAAAALRHCSGDEVLATRAVVDGGTVTLVGTGDMTLSEEDLSTLAAETAALVREQGTEEVTLALDTSALSGGANPAWGDNGIAGGWVAPTAALAVDGGRLDGEQYGPKSTDPAGDAAELFADLLSAEGITVTGEIGSSAAPEGAPVAEVTSEPIGDLVRHTLVISDNTTAELLAHLVARARGEPTTPQDAAAAVEAEIRDLGLELGVAPADLESLQILDGSG